MIYGKAQINGSPEIRRKLKQFGVDGAIATKRAIDRTALAIESDAKVKITTDGHIITNRLRASIHAELKKGAAYSYSDNKGMTFDGSLAEPLEPLEAVVGTNVKYAPYIEFGTKYFSGDSFLRWAAQKQTPLFVKRLEDELNKLIKKFNA